MMFLLAAVVLQGGPWQAVPPFPTVGDTVVLERFVPTIPGAAARLRELDRSDRVEPLGPPEVLAVAGGIRIRQPVAFFAAGRQSVAMPVIELVHPDGAVEVILGDTAVVSVASVIPDSVRDPRPQPSQAPLARPVRQPWRALVPSAVVLAVLAAWLAWRRRAPRPAVPVEVEPGVPELPLMRWLATGERRAVATLAAHRLRAVVAARLPEASPSLALEEWRKTLQAAGPEWPVGELDDVLAALERARFARLDADDLAELVDRVDVIVGQLPAADPERSQ